MKHRPLDKDHGISLVAANELVIVPAMNDIAPGRVSLGTLRVSDVPSEPRPVQARPRRLNLR